MNNINQAHAIVNGLIRMVTRLPLATVPHPHTHPHPHRNLTPTLTSA